MDVQTWGPEDYSAAAAVLGLMVAVVVATFAALQVLQARTLREEQARPYIIVDFEFRRYLVQIAISNIGATPARNVLVRFDRPLQAVSDNRMNINEASIFTAPIPMMAPGRKILVPFDSATALYGAKDIPLAYTATVTFLDHRGKPQTDEYPLDLRSYLNTTVPPDGIPEVSGHLKDLRNDLKKVIRSGHVRVKSSDADIASRRQARGVYLEQGKQVFRESGVRGWVRWRTHEFLVRHGWLWN